MPADAVLLAGARLPGADRPVAVRLRGGVVDRVEPDVAARGASAAAERVERVELDGRWIVPGLWDEHVHFSQWAVSRRRVDVGHAASAAEAAATIRTAIDAALVDDLVVARDFRDDLWPDRPSAAALDAVVPERAVVVVSSDLHALWLNSRALTAFGLPDHPTGVLREGEAFALHPRITAVPERRLDAWVADAARAAAARGVVGIHDLEMHGNLEGWSRRMAAGFDVLRVDSGVYPDALDRALDAGLRTGLELSPLHRVGHCKVITDGSLGTRTAFCADPYPDTDDRGVLAAPPEALRALLERAIAGGFVPRCTRSATRRTGTRSTSSSRSARAGASSTRSCSTSTTSRASPRPGSPRASSPSTRWTTATSRSGTGPVASTARISCVRSSTPV